MRIFNTKLSKPLLLGVICSIPAIAYAATLAVKVTVNGQPTPYRAIIVNGTTYVALRDVATMTGRNVSFDGRTNTVDVSGGGSMAGMGGTTQRAGSEGKFGQMLTIPEVSLRVDKVVVFEEGGDKWTRIEALIRNTSKDERSYGLRDARLALKDNQQLGYSLTAAEVGGGSYAGLQRGEETTLKIVFKGEYKEEDIDRLVITLSVDSYAKVFRVKF